MRILAEYLEPLYRFEQQKVPGTVVFFGSARLRREWAARPSTTPDARELARLYTTWTNTLPPRSPRFLICSGGGHGIMEAANRGAADAGGRTIGLNISLPEEQSANPYITPDLSFEFHYFFMRKLWFAHMARAVVVFPGGFGTHRRNVGDPDLVADAQARRQDDRSSCTASSIGTRSSTSMPWSSTA